MTDSLFLCSFFKFRQGSYPAGIVFIAQVVQICVLNAKQALEAGGSIE